jgi:acyl-CoA synthetase (AMP-forming)/AMP-acid ligase II
VSSAGISSGCLDGRKYFDPVEIDGDLYIDTNDLVFVNDDGSLSYAGRTNKYFVNQAGKRFDAGLVETAVAEQPGIESCGIAPVLDKREHDTVPALYVQMAGETKNRKAKLIQALKNVFIYDDRIKDNNLPSWCVITDNIPYNESGKVDVHKILNNEIGGKAYRTEAEYSDGVLTDIKLVKAEVAPGQMAKPIR